MIKNSCSSQPLIRLEDELLFFCARTTLNEGAINRVQELANGNIDWKYFVENAIHHRVIPLVFQSLKSVCEESVPPGILSGFKKYSLAIAKHNLFLTAELLKLIEFLDASGIEAIPYKGPSAAFLAYGNVCLRQFNDLDILVRPNAYEETRRLLLKLGFQIIIDLEWECTLANDKRGICIDVHKSITPQKYSIHLDFDYLWSHLIVIPAVGGKIRTPGVEDFLLILCIQMAKDSWGETPLRLSKVCDIAELLRYNPKINWNNVFEEAKKRGFLRMLKVGLYCAHNWLDSPMPQSISQPIAKKKLNFLIEHVFQELIAYTEDSHPGRLPAEKFYSLTRERWRDRYYPNYYHLKLRLIPNNKDRLFIKIPESLAFLYYIIRPIRLLRDWATHGTVMVKKRLFIWKD